MAEEKTKITPINQSELNDLLNLGGPENVITPVEKPISPLSRTTFKDSDLNLVLEKPVETPVESEPLKEEQDLSKTKDLDLVLGEVVEDKNEDLVVKKTVFFDALTSLVKDEKILLFDEDKPLEKYTKKEIEELLVANQDRIREEEGAKLPAEFFDSLPSELQYAAKYVFDGGTDLKSLFKYLGQAEEVKSLDISTEKGQEQTVRTYLSMQGDLDPQEIEEEINSLKDQTGALEKKAGLYKPKIDAKQQQIIEKELKDQESRKKQQESAAVKYRENILNALKPGILDGIKITQNVQGMLFNGLTQANYPSVSGRNTNLFGHLIEKYQYVEPNPVLIAKALWLLQDPKGFEDAIKSVAVEGETGRTFRELKTAGQQKSTPATTDTQHNAPIKKTIQKKAVNLFART